MSTESEKLEVEFCSHLLLFWTTLTQMQKRAHALLETTEGETGKLEILQHSIWKIEDAISAEIHTLRPSTEIPAPLKNVRRDT